MDNEELIEEPTISLGYEKFQVISKTYANNFNECRLIVFNSETGELKKQVIRFE